MTSLDGYSLNAKMDRELEKLNEQIEILHFRMDEELKELRQEFKGSAKKIKSLMRKKRNSYESG